MVPDPLAAVQLRIATWNLEHLNDTDDAGCVPRDEADYDAIADAVREIAPDVVAFQEVENMAAALRVFPATRWHVEVSMRPVPQATPRECWRMPGKYLHQQATGFAIRKEIVYQRHDDLESLGDPAPHNRWGTDISVALGDRQLRLVSVHLKSGCWSAEQDLDESDAETCATLRDQFLELRSWADLAGRTRAPLSASWATSTAGSPSAATGHGACCRRYRPRSISSPPTSKPSAMSDSTNSSTTSCSTRPRRHCWSRSRPASGPGSVTTRTTAPCRPISGRVGKPARNGTRRGSPTVTP